VIGYHATCQHCGKWEEITRDEYEARCPTHWYLVTIPYFELELEAIVQEKPRIYCSSECVKNAITDRLNETEKMIANLKRDFPDEDLDAIKLPR
jgi:hypothetical protein